MTNKGCRHTEEDYKEYLDNDCEPVKVLGHEYGAGQVLSEIDPVAFNDAYRNWIDCEGCDGEGSCIEEEEEEEEEESEPT